MEIKGCFLDILKLTYHPEVSKRAIEFRTRCLAMNLEKHMAIDEALLDGLISISPVELQNTKMKIQ
jgi:hypothetical protein